GGRALGRVAAVFVLGAAASAALLVVLSRPPRVAATPPWPAGLGAVLGRAGDARRPHPARGACLHSRSRGGALRPHGSGPAAAIRPRTGVGPGPGHRVQGPLGPRARGAGAAPWPGRPGRPAPPSSLAARRGAQAARRDAVR